MPGASPIAPSAQSDHHPVAPGNPVSSIGKKPLLCTNGTDAAAFDLLPGHAGGLQLVRADLLEVDMAAGIGVGPEGFGHFCTIMHEFSAAGSQRGTDCGVKVGGAASAGPLHAANGDR